MPLLPLATSTRPAAYSSQRLINYFFLPTPEGPNAGALLGRPGLSEVASVGGSVRALVSRDGGLYAVADAGLWKINATAVRIGDVRDDAYTSVDIANSGICIVAGGVYYHFDGAAITPYSTGQVATPKAVAVIDGMAVVVGSDATRADRYAMSSPVDVTSFDGLDFGTAEALVDPAVGVIRDHTEVKIFGSDTIETFYNSGDGIARNSSVFMERGCYAGQTIAKADNGVYWVGNDRKVYRAFGGMPEVISTPEINEYLAAAQIDRGFAFEARGQKFYCVQTGTTSFVFCIPTSLWSEFTTGADHQPWKATCACLHLGVWYFGTSDGKVAVMAGWQDGAEPVRAEAISVPLTGDWNQINKLRLSMDTGTGSLGRDRIANLEMTRDGKIWSAPMSKSLGDQGEYRRDVWWNGLGRHRKYWQAKVWVTDPVQRDIYGVEVNG